MSFILESIKQAERERNIGQVPNISVQHALPHEEAQNTWLRWGVASLIMLALALFAWGAAKTFQLNKAYQSQNYSQNGEIAEHQNKTSLLATDEIVTKEENVKHNMADEDKIENKKFNYVASKNLHHSKLQAVQDINFEEEEAIEKVENEVTQVVAVEIPSSLNTKNVSEDIVEPEKQIVKALSPKEKIHSLYAELAADKSEVVANKDREALKISLEEEARIALENEILHEQPTLIEDAFPAKNVPPVQSATAVNTGVQSFGELPYDIQQQVPDLRISVHMFNIEPTQRRIRINGRMYTEGEAMQDELALVEITRYGAIFDYQGHTFHLNVR